ncbi:hypothetical protein COO60DRAFT_1137034 [Scenedesmus sp. NREL 46B-D3]|nr:hypothetical protein COO60DRAFT_1137034 [Scenedesmus sp. NREL 46B-D3]
MLYSILVCTPVFACMHAPAAYRRTTFTLLRRRLAHTFSHTSTIAGRSTEDRNACTQRPCKSRLPISTIAPAVLLHTKMQVHNTQCMQSTFSGSTQPNLHCAILHSSSTAHNAGRTVVVHVSLEKCTYYETFLPSTTCCKHM